MAPVDSREVWLRGPVPGIPALLQPVAHALLQAREEVTALMEGFPGRLLWERPAGVASPGFHLQHLTGVLDRLFTYARQQQLSVGQLAALQQEGKPPVASGDAIALVARFSRQVDQALAQLRDTDPDKLLQARGVGRAQLPSTVLGLYFHAAEHTMRHIGQLTVTSRMLNSTVN